MDDQGLETLFAAERVAPPEVPDALMARVLLDAAALQNVPRAGMFARLWAGLGGAPGMGGLVTATCVGFWLGVAPPEVFPDLAGAMLGIQDVLLADAGGEGLSGFGWDIEDGDQDG